MPEVRLSAIDDPVLRAEVLRLEPLPDEVPWSGRASESLPVAEADPTRHPVAILAGDEPVGFFAFDTGPRARTYAPEGVVGLHSFFVDRRHRRQGHALAALRLAPALAQRWFPEALGLALTVNVRNAPAIATYLDAGFTDAGERFLGGEQGPQHVLHAPWPARTGAGVLGE